MHGLADPKYKTYTSLHTKGSHRQRETVQDLTMLSEHVWGLVMEPSAEINRDPFRGTIPIFARARLTTKNSNEGREIYLKPHSILSFINRNS
jgi:hypothetical protein